MADHWGVRTADGSRSAQYEHSLAITDSGAEILTLL
jgi:methionyl aminopeptidase